uniref:Uncharacterized protein n=1 Tax=Candidatus Kentrum sp. LFY TaxID=2126342 RepID=A0A450WGF1_9GAMM|nr:MAG: hypothetical protein BECKLFY1418C_GA0070996_102027 [Candidatus Kentron sp. LFY]
MNPNAARSELSLYSLALRAKAKRGWTLAHASVLSDFLFRYRKNKDLERTGARAWTHPASVLARSANMFFRYVNMASSKRTHQ